MAHIDYSDGFFYGIGAWEDRDLFKGAGFTYSSRRKAWITQRQKDAQAVKGATWSERAIQQIEDRLRNAEISRDLSYKASTTYNPPIPQALLDMGIDYKPFQKAGIDYATQPGRKDTLFGDPPGLGKTIQAIGVANALRRARQILVVVPASLKVNWKREWEKWDAKGLSVGIAETQHREKIPDGLIKSGKNKGKPKFRTEVHKTWWPDTEVVIINYDILERFSTPIADRVWDILICDECHVLKTPDSGRTLFVLGDAQCDAGARRKARKKKGVKWFNAIDAKRRLFLSGTPMMNRPIELWPMVKAFDPDGLGSDYLEFGYRYCNGWFDPMRGPRGSYDFTGSSNREELGARLREMFMVRRQKKEVLPELPDKFRQVVLLDSPEIRELVAREDEIAQAMRLYESTVLAPADETPEERDIRMGLSAMDNAFKMGFDRAVGQDGDPDRPNSRAINLPYAAAVLGLSEPMVQVMFEEIAQVRRDLGLAKLSAAIPWLKNFLEGGEKLLIFAYHSDVVLAVKEALAEYNPAVVYGGTPLKKRQPEVDRFQEDESCRVFIGNLQAAGVGFTLTRASDVCFLEADWTPTLMEQCEDRACRIGQTAFKIMVFFLMADGSLDARIAQASKEKADNIDAIMDT
ncbi:helicase [Bajunvirus bajun]|uniref:Helicase n=1 Tax=Brevundimonas phage vB_BgoS-Bajun TaxID=2948594 RepID=A0A9E7N550_9CAUD|nr:helicase [Brevundimonas phage vB_BgoS-Bajun]